MTPWDARLARALVRPFRNTRVVPNHFTTLRLAVGLAGAWVFAVGDAPNTAAMLIVLSNFLDHTDGELARMSGKSSRLGHVYDLASDALVTVLMFVGMGIGARHGALGALAPCAGFLAGLAVAGIFHMRNQIENNLGKSAVRQPHFAGFEAEDVLYLLPLVTLFDGLDVFLGLAAIGAPLAALRILPGYLRLRRSPSRAPHA